LAVTSVTVAAIDVSIDVGAIVTTLIWVGLLVVVLLVFRRPMSALLSDLPGRVRSVSAAGVTVEFMSEPVVKAFDFGGVRVDLRHAGTPNEVNDSTLASFYRQFEVADPVPHVLVDLGSGDEWLSSRLYILAVLLRRMRRLETVTFVESGEGPRRRFVGICEAEPMGWRLAAQWPRYESALAAAEVAMWGSPMMDPPVGRFGEAFRIVDSRGRVVPTLGQSDGEAAASLLRGFLSGVQRTVAPPASGDIWQPLRSAPSVFEQAEWLDGQRLAAVLGDALDQTSISLGDWRSWSNQHRVRAVVESEGRFVAVTADGMFDGLVDRGRLLERIAEQVSSGS
jgi:hypothetical protein